MKLLSKQAFASAKQYLENYGRKPDLAWYRLVFADGTKEEAHNSLKAYQWNNGGFGYSLAPDHRTALPSCQATCVAFRWFENLGLPETDAMLKNAVTFLKNNYNVREQRWPAFPEDANKDPHAIWWHYNEGEELCDAEKTWGLPSAEILGILLKYDSDNELWRQCFEKAINRLNEVYPNMEINEASCFVRMLDYLNGKKKKRVSEKMFGVLENILETDENKWTEYCAKPLMYIHDPSSPFYRAFRELIEKNLDWEIDKQTDEGCWIPNWQWYRDEKYWPQARDEWKSYLTVEKLVVLEIFGRIEKR